MKNLTTETLRHGEEPGRVAQALLPVRKRPYLRKQAPARVPVPHEFGHSHFNLRTADRVGQDEVESGTSQKPVAASIPSTSRHHSNVVVLAVTKHLRLALELVLATLREIFDENAYERFLKRTQALRSVESYSVFLREREAGVAQRPRCC